MKYLVAISESTAWANYSSLVFTIFFISLVLWVFRPWARKKYEKESMNVFDDGKKS
jgi:cbb3-type cytochrome oxidase subunit 3